MITSVTTVQCDGPDCKKGFSWSFSISQSQVEALIKRKGWKTGKRVGQKALCPVCRLTVKKGEGK